MNQLMIFVFTFLMLMIATTESVKQEVIQDWNLKVDCARNQGIKIYDATWTYQFWDPGNFIQPDLRNFIFVAGGVTGGVCTYDVVEKVREKCEGKQNCNFIANRELFPTPGIFGDETITNCHYSMKLIVNYDCLPCNNQPKSKRGVGIQCDAFTDLVPRLNNQWSDRIGCPHQSFITKHICEGCTDAAWAAEQFAIGAGFQRTHGQTVDAPFNSVFVLNHVPMTYHQVDDAVCVFDRTAVKYNCRSNANSNSGWTCNRIGNIRAKHDLINGHYLYQQDQRS